MKMNSTGDSAVQQLKSIFATLIAICIWPAAAYAHHVMDGALPKTVNQGLLSGIAHPIIGADHLAFIVAVGLLAAIAGRSLLLPLFFVAGTLAGAAIHLANLDIHNVEPLIALSVATAGVLLVLSRGPGLRMMGFAFVMAGIVHGYAYAESIIGAERSVLSAYLLAFSATQYTIAIASGWLFVKVSGADLSVPPLIPRLLGLAICIFGGLALFTALGGALT